MAQLVEPPDIQSNPVGETAPNDYFITSPNNYFNRESDRTNIEDPNLNVSNNDIPPINGLSQIPGLPPEIYNFSNISSLIAPNNVHLDSDKDVRDALLRVDINEDYLNQLQNNDQLKNNDKLHNNDQLPNNDQLQNNDK